MIDLTDANPTTLSWEDLTAAYVATTHNRVSAERTMRDLRPDLRDPVYRAAYVRHTALVNDQDAFAAEVLRRVAGQVVPGLTPLDLESSASRQHYIDTGRYLRVGEEVHDDC